MIHHLIRGTILTGFSLLILYLFHTGEISLYIAPRMELLVKLSALGLYAAAAYQFYAALQKRVHKHTADCGCSHHPSPSKFKNTVIYCLFLFPLLIGFIFPTGTLGSSLAAKKGVSFSGNESITRKGVIEASSSALVDELFPFDDYTIDHAKYGKILYEQSLIQVPEKQFIETLTTLDLYRNAFIGKEIEISGFVYREEDMGQDRLAVSRFAMNCCSADSLPYGLMIKWPQANEYGSDEWVSVTGKLTTSMYNENEIITIDVTSITRIDAPASPYVYPDLQFGY
ncbi:TIGR03943 family protein [Paenibacillus sp. GSMTC-2017]|uniref:TIGR03943 family putative permease subunit n=1 Tax=Paenibacillus sp. GSMTC-2017 TaxID=2794350 RepID=UPI0018D70443|nr:TIGR03943 family protein [Paenibacillus sp. GSMTC-2017]MBH5319183.1 TIGR03943 family protein [Paenibacillus sp. GSMTC-2017]